MQWSPTFIVLHNTSSPTIAQRPSGFTSQHMKNLQEYYSGMGWSGGPHCFIDQNGIWVFNPITVHGVHSPSWNSVAFGVEMLGEFDTEAFDSSTGLQIQENAVGALAALCNVFNFDPETIKLHKEDPYTTHKNCPGKNVLKTSIITQVKNKQFEVVTKVIFYKKGEGTEPAATINGVFKSDNVNYAKAADLTRATGIVIIGDMAPIATSLSDYYTFHWDESNLRLYCVQK